MNKFIEIAKSWIVAFNPTPEQKEIAEYRMSECNKCEFKKYIDFMNIYVCDLCGCPLQGKIFSPDKNSCPTKKWKK